MATPAKPAKNIVLDMGAQAVTPIKDGSASESRTASNLRNFNVIRSSAGKDRRASIQNISFTGASPQQRVIKKFHLKKQLLKDPSLTSLSNTKAPRYANTNFKPSQYRVSGGESARNVGQFILPGPLQMQTDI